MMLLLIVSNAWAKVVTFVCSWSTLVTRPLTALLLFMRELFMSSKVFELPSSLVSITSLIFLDCLIYSALDSLAIPCIQSRLGGQLPAELTHIIFEQFWAEYPIGPRSFRWQECFSYDERVTTVLDTRNCWYDWDNGVNGDGHRQLDKSCRGVSNSARLAFHYFIEAIEKSLKKYK